MFEYIKGNYEEQASDYIVVDHQGMGYRINVSANTMSELPKLHKEVKVYIHPAFKEDDVMASRQKKNARFSEQLSLFPASGQRQRWGCYHSLPEMS